MSKSDDSPRHEPPYPDQTQDPRPWWFREFLRDLYQRLNTTEAMIERRFKATDARVDRLESIADEQIGGARAARSNRERWTTIGGLVLVIVGLIGLIITVIQAVTGGG